MKLKYDVLLVVLLIILHSEVSKAQYDAVIPPSNRSTTSLEKNLLFYADTRFSVSQSGSVSMPVSYFFDGNYMPVYSPPINAGDPYIILIDNLPDIHVQAGAWIGWSTRYYNPVRFKIEVFNIYEGANTWITVSDQVNYQQGSHIVQAPHCSVGKIRFTFYQGNGPGGSIGLSELFFIHNEATSAYDNLMVKYNSLGNVGIGTSSPSERLSVKGRIRAQEIKVESTNWPDFVFDKDYRLTSLDSIENYINKHGHLPQVPSAAEINKDGVLLGEMNKTLLMKIEELTLYLISLKKRMEDQDVLHQQQATRFMEDIELLKKNK